MSDWIDKGKISQFHEVRMSDYLEILGAMVSINSFTANSDGVNDLGDLTAGYFTDIGFSAEKLPSENPFYGDHLILTRKARRSDQAPTISFVSHLDTVFPPDDEKKNNFYWRIEGNRAFGPGTVDIKGGTVMIYMILQGLRNFSPILFEDTNWIILLNAAEETLVREFGNMCRSKLPKKTLACLVFEGGRHRKSRSRIVTARKGMATYRIVVEGKASHAGSAHRKGANAIVQLAQTISKIAELTDYQKGVTFNTATIAGGTVLNRVPHMAVASGEMRAYSPAELEEGMNRLLALQDEANITSSKGRFRCKIDVKIMDQWQPWPRNEGTDKLFRIWQNVGSEMGCEVIAQERGGLSDGNWLWDYIPTLDGLGPSGGNAHCSERSDDGKKEQEYVDITSFVPKATLNTLAIERLLRNGSEEREYSRNG